MEIVMVKTVYRNRAGRATAARKCLSTTPSLAAGRRRAFCDDRIGLGFEPTPREGMVSFDKRFLAFAAQIPGSAASSPV